jgi:hypothetical protein
MRFEGEGNVGGASTASGGLGGAVKMTASSEARERRLGNGRLGGAPEGEVCWRARRHFEGRDRYSEGGGGRKGAGLL